MAKKFWNRLDPDLQNCIQEERVKSEVQIFISADPYENVVR